MTLNDDWFRHSSNIKCITSTILQAVVLELQIQRIQYDVEMASGGMNIHTKFHTDWLQHSSNIKLITSTICEAAV
jgi:hypothetical protein